MSRSLFYNKHSRFFTSLAMFSRTKVEISEEVYCYYTPFMWLFRNMCLFPFVVERNESQVFLKLSPFWVGYSCTGGVCIIVFGYYVIISDMIDGEEAVLRLGSDAVKLLAFIHITCYNLIFICWVFLMSVRFLKLFDYIHCLNKADAIIKTTYKRADKCKAALLLTTSFFMIIAFDTSDLVTTIRYKNEKISVLHVLRLYTSLFVASTEAVVIENFSQLMLRSLEIRIRRLNEVLGEKFWKLKRTNALKILPWVCVGSTNKNRFLGRDTFLTTSTTTNSKEELSDQTNRFQDNTIDDLSRAYMDIVEASATLYSSLGPSALAYVFSAFWALTMVLYFLGLYTSNTSGTIYHLIGRIIWFSVTILRVLVITEAPYSHLVQIQTTKRWAAQLLSYNLGRSYRRKVKTFALILGLQRIEFCPCGLFRIDRELFLTLSNGIITMLIILLQQQTQEKV